LGLYSFQFTFLLLPTLLLIYVRQQQYADDTQLMLFISPSNINNKALETVSQQTILVADVSVSLSDHIKLLGIALDKRLTFDKHVSNVCSTSYFHIRALRYIRAFLDFESSKSIACAIVSSRLDYANS